MVKQDIDLYTVFNSSKETYEEYDKCFNARVDVMNVHSGESGYHKAIYNKHVTAGLQVVGVLTTVAGEAERATIEHAQNEAKYSA